MQRAIPTRIKPYMSIGWSRRKTTARTNISTGPTIQFWTIDSPSTFVSRKMVGSSSYFTLASGGYIMRISPMAIGIDVVPAERPVITTGTAGKKYPIPIPTAIARKIQRVRYRSRKESCLPVAMRGLLYEWGLLHPQLKVQIFLKPHYHRNHIYFTISY